MRRRDFILSGGAAALALACNRKSEKMTARQPVLFVGHGSPMNAVEDNAFSRGFTALGESLPRPAAILAISAHWYVPATLLTDNASPRTIHDFGGFPERLYEIEYPAPGNPSLAAKVRERLGEAAALSADWGLDHGTWSVLVWMFPRADVPVIQLSVDRRLSPAEHLELARSLVELRDDGVLILGSGNITHNLRDAFGRMHSGNRETPAWAERFDAAIAQAIGERGDDALTKGLLAGDDGKRSHPSLDHYLPLLYAYAASEPGDAVSFPVTGFDMGSISMRAIRFG